MCKETVSTNVNRLLQMKDSPNDEGAAMDQSAVVAQQLAPPAATVGADVAEESSETSEQTQSVLKGPAQYLFQNLLPHQLLCTSLNPGEAGDAYLVCILRLCSALQYPCPAARQPVCIDATHGMPIVGVCLGRILMH